MAVDKLVDSAQLDSDLEDIADAIRAKSGGSGQLAFPAGFISEIGSIETGGSSGYTVDGIADLSEPTGNITLTVQTIGAYAFSGRNGITSISSETITSLGERACFNCTNLETFICHGLTNVGANALYGTKVAALALPNFLYSSYYCFGNMKSLVCADIGSTLTSFNNAVFQDDILLSTLILRRTTVLPIAQTNALSNTPFASGGTGGTIYIPKALYDHLGDGTSLDYKAATNWSTYDAYGTITWAQIEGSQYENYYADGTPIPTT